MEKRQNIESQIRDYISTHLDVIEPNLQLIEVEYYLKNSGASSGFVDVLAQDEFNQFVVIEIKRSDKASRNAANEVLKYLNLLKQNYKVNDSDVRFILISTTWNELIHSFSELYNQSKISIIGYEIVWENNCISSKKSVSPIEKYPKRMFSPVQMIYLYRNNDKSFENGINNLVKNISDIGLSDYVILFLFNDRLKNPRIIYPYGLYFAFYRMSEKEYFKLLQQEQINDILIYKSELKNENDFENQYYKYVENHLMSNITTTRDTAESGYPEKLDAIISQNWKIFDIYKNGVFKNDPRQNDFIINDIRGEKGLNTGRYRNSTRTSHRSRFEEIKDSSHKCLANNETWNDDITNVIKYIDGKKEEQDITIDIYNPPSILNIIYQYVTKKDKRYLPTFIISIKNDKAKTLEIFTGHIGWNGRLIEFDKLRNLISEKSGFILELALTADFYRDEIINTFGLVFETFYNKNILNENLDTLISENRISPGWDRNFCPISFIESGNFEIIESHNYNLDSFIEKNSSVINVIKQLIDERTIYL